MALSASALVTVVIPAFNVGPYIGRCVRSVLQQTHRELEVIVVNDASVDETAAVLDGLMAADVRLKVLHLAENVGVHAARAHGLRVAAGSYVGFVDSDDWIAPQMYEVLRGEAARSAADIVVCGATTVLSDDQLGSPKVRFRRRQVLEKKPAPESFFAGWSSARGCSGTNSMPRIWCVNTPPCRWSGTWTQRKITS